MSEITNERLRNTRTWATARVGSLSGAEVIVAACDEALAARANVNAEGSELFALLFNSMTKEQKMDVPEKERDRITEYMVANGYRFVFARWYKQADPFKEPE